MAGLSDLLQPSTLDEATAIASAMQEASGRRNTASRRGVDVAAAGLRARAKQLAGNGWQGPQADLLKYADTVAGLNSQAMTRSGRNAALGGMMSTLGQTQGLSPGSTFVARQAGYDVGGGYEDEVDPVTGQKKRRSALGLGSALGAFQTPTSRLMQRGGMFTTMQPGLVESAQANRTQTPMNQLRQPGQSPAVRWDNTRTW